MCLHPACCSLRIKPWPSNDAPNSIACAGNIIVPLCCRHRTLFDCGSMFFSESAERLLQSPGEFRGAAGAGQSDAVLLWDGRLHSGNRPTRLPLWCCHWLHCCPARCLWLHLKWLIMNFSVHIYDLICPSLWCRTTRYFNTATCHCFVSNDDMTWATTQFSLRSVSLLSFLLFPFPLCFSSPGGQRH